MFAKAGVKDKDVHSTRTSLNVNLDLDGDATRAVMRLVRIQKLHIGIGGTLPNYIFYFIFGAPC